jgi:hypothetical protein
MKTIEINLYKFEELSEEAQAKAIKNHQTHSNYEWWDCIEMNAKECGVIIDSFDTYRGDISLSFKWNAEDVAHELIKFWGADSDIGEISGQYLKDRETLYIDYSSDKEDELLNEFHSDVSHYFLKQLRDELEWIESDEYAKEYLCDMDYDFMEDGTEY